MKIKSFKRIGTLFLACMMCMCMCFGMYTTVSAAETVTEEISITPRDGANTVYPGAANRKTFDLAEVSGQVSVNLTFVTASEAKSGSITWELLWNDNVYKTGSVGINDMEETPMVLTTGVYKVRVTNNANQKASVFAYLVER